MIEDPGGDEERGDDVWISSVRDAQETPAWTIHPPGFPRPGGLPAVVTDPEELTTPLLRRILKVLREEYDPEFAIRWLGPLPGTILRKPVAEVRVALVTTAGLNVVGDRPFDPYADKWGDPGVRFIPHLASPDDLDLAAEYVADKYVPSDPEVALPMRALQHWVDEGTVGSAGSHHASFCEGVVRPVPALLPAVREAAAVFRGDGVDAALLLPTCSLCVNNASVIARELEASGIATATVTLLPELTELVGIPRPLAARFPFGAPAGDPGNDDLHRRVVRALLDRLAQEPSTGPAPVLDAPWRG